MQPRLSVLKIIRDTFQFAWEKNLQIPKALSIPMFLSCGLIFCLYLILQYFSQELGSFNIPLFPGILLLVLLFIIFLAPYVLFTVTCHRLVLIGDSSVPPYGLRNWTKREWYFLFWLIALPFVYLLTILLHPIIFGLASEFNIKIIKFQTGLGEINLAQWIGYLLTLPSVYIFSRLSLIFPATAVDRDVDVDWAWKLSRGNGWRMTIIIGALPMGFDFLTSLLWRENSTWMEDTIIYPIIVILLAIEIIALSFSYKYLTENKIEESPSG